MSPKDDGYISAADVEKYGYCPLSWWLSRGEDEPEESETLEKGAEKHAQLSSEITKIKDHEEKVKETDTGILYFSMGATIVSVVGLSFLPIPIPDKVSQILAAISLIWLLAACYYLYRAETLVTEDERLIAERLILGFAMTATIIAILAFTIYISAGDLMTYIMEGIALIWLIGACFYLYMSLKHIEEARIFRIKHEIEGEVKYVDDENAKPKLISSAKYKLRGRPDYVLLIENDHIPVEVKTGRVPRGPLFSHILQIAAYCLLIEEEFGTAPPFGILKYGTLEHEIDYNEELKGILLEKLNVMRKLVKAGGAHRNHNRPGKCKYCSRREVCPEKLE